MYVTGSGITVGVGCKSSDTWVCMPLFACWKGAKACWVSRAPDAVHDIIGRAGDYNKDQDG